MNRLDDIFFQFKCFWNVPAMRPCGAVLFYLFVYYKPANSVMQPSCSCPLVTFQNKLETARRQK